MIIKLTPEFIANNLHCPEGKRRIEFVDTGGTGLYVEVRATSPGQGTYYLRYKDDSGKTCHAKIGRTTDIELDEARRLAKIQRAEITLGKDPRKEEKTDGSALSYSDFFEKQALTYLKTRKISWDKDEQYYRLRIKKVFGSKKLDQITRHEIQTFLMALKEEGLAAATCNHHVKSLRHTLALALDWELIEKNRAQISLIPENNKIEFIPGQEQMGRFIRVLREDSSVIARLIEYLLLTSCRLSEGTQLRWSEVNLEREVCTLTADRTKGKRARTLPLSKMAVQLLKSLDSYETTSMYVFPNPKTGKPYRSPYKKFNSLKFKAGMPKNYRLHDCRHWGLTQVVSNNHSLETAKLLAGHSSSQITERYLHCGVQQLRGPTETVAKALQDAADSASDAINAATTD